MLAGMARFIREWAAPEDAGPVLAMAMELGEAAVAQLGGEPAPPEVTPAGLARLPERPPANWLVMWRRLGRLWQASQPGRPPDSIAELYARCLARAAGGQFPFYPEDD